MIVNKKESSQITWSYSKT